MASLRDFWSVLVLGLSLVCASAQTVRSWVTTQDLSMTFQEQPTLTLGRLSDRGANIIRINPSQRYQKVLGMGASLEHTTCSNLARLPDSERDRVIARLVSPKTGIGMNLMRVCIGTSDFTGDPWYSYDDLPPGETDPHLKRFSIERDQAYILPALRSALRANPDLLFFASAWSPPGWMKTTGTMIGGKLKREWYPTYAAYFVRFLQAYEGAGIPIYAVTVQNEPGVDRAKEKDPKWFYPSCHWTGEEERDFIRDHLGPALERAGLKTQIWCYDHNYTVEAKGESAGLGYPRSILQDPKAAAFVSGVGFHHYDGEASAMTQFHHEFPKMPLYFTEGSVFDINGAYDLVERWRNWTSSYNAWVVMLDEQGRPNNGPFPATRAHLRLHSDTLQVEELFEFHLSGHFSRFVRRGAVRIDSGAGHRELNTVAFRNPDGSVVLVAVNTTKTTTPLRVHIAKRGFDATLPPLSLGTFVIAR